MDFTFSEEQEALRASVREFLLDRYPIGRVASIADGAGFDRREWREVADLGWAGISAPETLGGTGLGFLDELVVEEELGRALYPGPFLATVVMALHALVATGAEDLAGSIVSGERIATVAWAGVDGGFDTDPPPKVSWEEDGLSGVKLFVTDLRSADLLLVVGATVAGPGLWVVDRDSRGVAWRELPTVDATRPLGEVVLEEAPASALAWPDHRLLDVLRDRALASLAVEAVGVATRALELGVEYARTREQFGKPIGAYQAVGHQLAQAFVEVETARSLAYWAGWAVAEGTPEASVAAATAKARAAQASVAACERAIQVHGGIGFTWEHPLHRYYKRALGIASIMGTGPELRRRVAGYILDSDGSADEGVRSDAEAPGPMGATSESAAL